MASPCVYKPFQALEGFNKYWGALGYIPRSLNKALNYFGVTNKKPLVVAIAQRIAHGAFSRWGERCNAIMVCKEWKMVAVSARTSVSRGIG
jgi:hypothetical protein